LARSGAVQIANGPILEGVLVCHSCDNRRCCRPSHLFGGSYEDNARDMGRKGRAGAQVHPERVSRGDAHYSRRHPEFLARGERNGRHTYPERSPRGSRVGTAKLIEADVRVIREARAIGVPFKEIAAGFGVSVHAAEQIVYGGSWRHVPDREPHHPGPARG
jgi:hypothetical protein